MGEYVKPEFQKKAFTCPHCGVLAQIKWHMDKALIFNNRNTNLMALGYCFSECEYCKGVMCFVYKPTNNWSLLNGRMIYPKQSAIPLEKDMPEKVREIYEEASLVLGDSPRASCALLRLALQELMIYLRDNHGDYGD